MVRLGAVVRGRGEDLAEIGHDAALVQIAILVRVERIAPPVERDLCAADAVGETADDRPVMAVGPDIIGAGVVRNAVIALHHIAKLSRSVWRLERNEHTAIVGDARLHPGFVGQRKEAGWTSVVRRGAPILA
jgi:hypothetical protein